MSMRFAFVGLIGFIVLSLVAPRASRAAEDPFTLGPPVPTTLRSADENESQATTAPASATSPSEAETAGDATVAGGLVEFFAKRFSAHEPMYFVAGWENPEAKFQISLKYQLFDPTGPWATKQSWLGDLYVAYTQTSFWDFSADNSSPFFDTSYRPEFLYELEDLNASWLGQSRFDFQAGVAHESNGKSGVDSRSLNVAYVRPIFTWGDAGAGRSRGFFVTVAPAVWAYLGSLDDNENIADYYGYGDLRVIVGWRSGLQLATTAYLGSDWDKGGLQMDLTYPLRALSGNNIDLYLDAQFFTGYGESLLDYDESTTTFRLGLALVR